MKKITLILFTVFLNIGLYSCTPEVIKENTMPQACCGEDIPFPPPPTDSIPDN